MMRLSSGLGFARVVAPVLTVIIGFGSIGSPVHAQATEAAKGECSRHVTGIVRNAGGEPAAGALVFTNVGGRAVSGSDGRFAFDTTVDCAAKALRVTAVSSKGGATHTASRELPINSVGDLDAETLALGASDSCEPTWLPGLGCKPGIDDGTIYAMTLFDDGSGSGPKLIIGGDFLAAGGAPINHIAAWDGTSWSAMGSVPTVRALAVYDSGSGPQLIAGTSYFNNGIYIWNGATWSALGGGANNTVQALTLYDDGSGNGPSLIAAGHFTHVGAIDANYIARWDGRSWSTLGSGMGGPVLALALEATTRGAPRLLAGGYFGSAGGVSALNVAAWNGSAWEALGGGVGAVGGVNAVASYLTSQGETRVVAGGNFAMAGLITVNNVAQWNGTTWSKLGMGVNGWVQAVAVRTDPVTSEPIITIGGKFNKTGVADIGSLAQWNGATWVAVGDKASGFVYALVVAPARGDEAERFLIGGAEGIIGDLATHGVAEWRDGAWHTFGTGADYPVWVLGTFDDGSGQPPQLIVGGQFFGIGGVEGTRSIAAWDGTAWHSLAGGIYGGVLALTTHDDGSGAGPRLIAAGGFTSAGGVPAKNVAAWNGRAWSALGTGLPGFPAYAVTTFTPSGSNVPQLIAGGEFDLRLARWNGTSWEGIGNPMSSQAGVRALGTYDDGNGKKLIVAGFFTKIGGVTTKGVAAWNGASWSALGSGLDSSSYALTVADLGDGPKLFVSGSVNSAVGGPAVHIARWDGTTWTPLGSGLTAGAGFVYAMQSYFDATRGHDVLAVGGDFTGAGGVPVTHLAQWDGATWSALGANISGIEMPPIPGLPTHPIILAMTTYDFDEGPSLLIGGHFTTSVAKDSFTARMALCPSVPCPADLDGDAAVGASDLGILLGAWGANGAADLDGDGVVGAADLALMLGAWGSCN